MAKQKVTDFGFAEAQFPKKKMVSVRSAGSPIAGTKSKAKTSDKSMLSSNKPDALMNTYGSKKKK